MPAKMIEFPTFLGINNISDIHNIKQGEMHQADNVEINNTAGINTRDGYSNVLSGAYHSLFANDNTIVIAKATELYAGDDISNLVKVADLTSTERIAYCDINGTIYWSNGVSIGRIIGFANQFITGMPAGKILTHYNSRLYVVRGREVTFSEVLQYDTHDTRKNKFQAMTTITMFRPVDNGIYISADKIYFKGGASPFEFTTIQVAEDQAIFGTDTLMDRPFTAVGDNTTFRFCGKNGIYEATSGGNIKCLTKYNYRPTKINEGSSICRIHDDKTQYISIIK